MSMPSDLDSGTPRVPNPSQTRLAIIGLGYVGLPLAVEFGKHLPTLGYDIDPTRIDELSRKIDRTHEVEADELEKAVHARFSPDEAELQGCNVYIVTVPTPINEHKQPDFTPLVLASRAIGRYLKRGDVVVYESTVYPGATEEVCVPELEHASGLVFNQDFTVGYSPERINPGDKQRRLTNIPKVTSGSTPETAEFVDELYGRILTAGTHRAPTIKVAEAAKVIENTQRDVNIALVNEFAMIFHRLGIDTSAVLEAAGTKWNFLPFRPGMVGGHCIGVDPYYLIQKAQSVGYYPDILLACRRINDAMGRYIAAEVVKLMIKKKHAVAESKVLVLGFTFKENCPDLRNTRVVDLIQELRQFGAKVDVYDPWADPEQARAEYGIELLAHLSNDERYSALILAVAHDRFRSLDASAFDALGGPGAVIYDVKGLLPDALVDGRL